MQQGLRVDEHVRPRRDHASRGWSTLYPSVEVHPYLGEGWTVPAIPGHAFAKDVLAVSLSALFIGQADIDVEVVSGGTGYVSGDESGTNGVRGIGAQ